MSDPKVRAQGCYSFEQSEEASKGGHGDEVQKHRVTKGQRGAMVGEVKLELYYSYVTMYCFAPLAYAPHLFAESMPGDLELKSLAPA